MVAADDVVYFPSADLYRKRNATTAVPSSASNYECVDVGDLRARSVQLSRTFFSPRRWRRLRLTNEENAWGCFAEQ